MKIYKKKKKLLADNLFFSDFKTKMLKGCKDIYPVTVLSQSYVIWQMNEQKLNIQYSGYSNNRQLLTVGVIQ